MNENVETPNVASLIADPEALKKLLIAQVRAKGGSQAFDSKAVLQNLVKQTIEAFLEVELEEHLGYAKHAPEGRGSGNSRNGATPKTIRGDFGEVEIETPRDRNGDFDPKIVAKRQTSVGNFTETVTSLYARGMTTREIEDHVKQIYGIEISPQFVSRATEQLQQQITDWQSRPLERIYPVVFVDGLRVSLRAFDRSSCEIGQRRRSPARAILLAAAVIGAACQSLPAARAAARTVFPHADVQLCVVHQIRNATKFVSFKDRKPFCAAMRPIYTAPTIEAAELALDRFEQAWGARYPMSVASWRNHWDGLTAFFKYPVEFRRLIYTTNAIESLHSQMRKNIASRKVFPHDDAVIKILFLNIRNFSHRWSRRQGWDIVMNQLAVMFGDRLRPEVIDGL